MSTTEALPELPPLPKPEGTVEIDCGPAPGGGREVTYADGYSADQMRDYACAALAATSASAEAATVPFSPNDLIGWISRRGLEALRQGASPTIHAQQGGKYDKPIYLGRTGGTDAPSEPADNTLRDALHLIIGVTEAKDCPGLDKPTDFAIAQSRGMRLGTIRQMAVKARKAIAAAPQPAPAEPSVSPKAWQNNKMNPWVCTLTPHQARRVGKTGEEVGELGSVLGRLNIQGLHEIDPSSGKTNFQRLWEESADVEAQTACNRKAFKFPEPEYTDRVMRKIAQMGEWEEHYSDATPPAEVEEVPTIDLMHVAYERLQQAASESNWIPPEYYANDWIADCCRWLREGPPVAEVEERRELSDEEIDALDTFALHVMAPCQRESVRNFARSILAASKEKAS